MIKPKKKKSRFINWLKGLFVNPDKKKKQKIDWIKWLARRHYINIFILTILLDLILLCIIGFNFKILYVSIPLIVLTIPFLILTICSTTSLVKFCICVALVKNYIKQILTIRSRAI